VEATMILKKETEKVNQLKARKIVNKKQITK
jgi:hypothetical protein